MNALIQLTHSTYSEYNIIIPRISYLSKVGFNNKLKEYYLEIGYDSKEFSKFILSFSKKEEAEFERISLLEKIDQFYKKS